MAEPPKYDRNGPPGSMSGSQEWANDYNKAVQAKQQEITDRKQAALAEAGKTFAPTPIQPQPFGAMAKQSERG